MNYLKRKFEGFIFLIIYLIFFYLFWYLMNQKILTVVLPIISSYVIKNLYSFNKEVFQAIQNGEIKNKINDKIKLRQDQNILQVYLFYLSLLISSYLLNLDFIKKSLYTMSGYTQLNSFFNLTVIGLFTFCIFALIYSFAVLLSETVYKKEDFEN